MIPTVTLTQTTVVNIIAALVVLCAVQGIGLVIVCILLCEQVGSRRSAERRANRLGNRVHDVLTRPAPVRSEAAETQQLPRYREPHVPTYKTAAVGAPSTALAVAPHREVARSPR